MSGYSVEQLKAISEYRAQNGLGAVISDDAVVSIMQKDMIKTGKIFPGFEFLAESPSSKQPAAAKSNVFGTGFNSNETIGLCVEQEHLPDIPLTLPDKKIGVAEKEGIDFLKTITGEADSIVKEHEKESGVLTSVVNSWQEVFNQEVAKSTITNEIKSAKLDIKTLELAAKGKSVTKNYFTGETGTISFEEMFKKQRGVEYNITNVVNCKQESEKFARIKTASEMINMTKQELSFLTRGDAQSSAGIQESSSAIIKAFNLSGITNKNDMNAFLSQIEEKYKDHPDIKKYGGNLRFEKLPNGKIYMMSTTNEGNNVPAGNEQLKIVAKEMSLRLDKTYAEALGINIPENATQEEITAMSKKVYDEHQRSYEKAFEEAFGSKDLKALANRYVETQQQSVANIEAGLNIASMALMIVPGAAAGASGWLLKGSVAMKSTSIGARAAETFNLVDKSKKLYKAANAVNDFLKGDSVIAKTLTKGKLNLGRQAILSTASTGNMILNPTTLLEQLSSENGMSAEEWKNWEKGVVQNTVYMAAGMGSSKIAEQGAAMYKTKALVKALKQTGKTTDEIAAMVKANPVKFPNDVVKSFNSIDNMAKALQISSEAAIDLSSTYMLNEAMGNGGLQKQDWIMSVGFALSGGALQKQFASMSTEAKAKYLQKAFKDINLSKFEAYNILSTMDKISSGEIRAKKDKPENNPFSFKPHQNDVINHVNEADTGIPAAGKRVQNAESKPKLTEETFLDELCSLYELDKNEIIKDPDAIKELNGIYSVYEKNSAEINNFIMKNEKGEYKYSKEFISWSLQKCLEGKYKCSDIKLFAAAYDIAQNPNPKYNPEIGISKLDFDLIQELVKSEIDVQGSDTFENGRTHSFEEVFDVLSMMDNDSQKKAVIELLQKDYTFGSDIPDITKIKTFKNDGDVKEFFSLIERLNAKKSERSPKQFLNIANVITSPKLEKMAVDLIDKGTEFDFTERLLKIADDGGYERINKLLTHPTEANKKELDFIYRYLDNIRDLKGTGIFAYEKLAARDIVEIQYKAKELKERDLLNPDKNYSKEQIILLAKASDKTYNTIIEHGLLDKYSAEDAAIIGYNYNKLKELGLLDIPDLRVEDMLVFLNRPETAKEFIDDPELSKLGAIGFDGIRKLLNNPDYRNKSIEYIKSIYQDENIKPYLSYILEKSMDNYARIDEDYAKTAYEKCKKICNNENRNIKEKKLLIGSVKNKEIDRLLPLIDDPEIKAETIVSLSREDDFGEALDLYDEIKKNNSLTKEHKNCLILVTNKNNIEIAKLLCRDENFPRKLILDIVNATNEDNIDYVKKICTDKKLEIAPSHFLTLINNRENISIKEIKKLNHTMGRQKVASLSENDVVIAARFVDIYNKNNINEIPVEGKKALLHNLVKSNDGLFNISEKLKADFPLLPTEREKYCELLPSIVRSLGVETNTLKPEQVESFNVSASNLSENLAKISDKDFADMTITQEISKEDFIKTTLKKVKDLSPQERQKVYDYFGFELHHNKNNETGFSITGYPVNLNNGKKLAQITDPATKQVVESLRSDVIKFSKENPIHCNDKNTEKFLNDIVDVLPELRPLIGKKQHGAHDFDVMQHSLKVMQKVSQDPQFKTLNESDKKVMILATMMHDITKGEGFSDKTHSIEGSFDTFFIAKKFNLTRSEEIKLYNLIKGHEWLEHVNTAKTEPEKVKRMQSIAFDMQKENLFDMALMLTHADLKAVKTDDSFHDRTDGRGRIELDGKVRSFGESADIYAAQIKDYVKELQKTQPILPVTKMPKTSVIKEAITNVNPDGSTNIKGVYQDKDGLVIIKFNEVEDWESIGLPKGSSTKGIFADYQTRADAPVETVETGNIKFFVHALEYDNQLAKFDAFSLVDSDALLSVSYAERPETKYRFFRPQGIMLDVETRYVHGGGNSDSGSGYGKSIKKFKDEYLFGAARESDRNYISGLVKEATGMDEAEYVKFVEQNKDKSMIELEPKEIREKIIKTFATINSNTRKGQREYNEMYVSNPKEIMGVFSYSQDTSPDARITDPVSFSTLNRTEFLRKYALEHDVPFYILGN